MNTIETEIYKSYFFILAILLSLTACATAHSNDMRQLTQMILLQKGKTL